MQSKNGDYFYSFEFSLGYALHLPSFTFDLFFSPLQCIRFIYQSLEDSATFASGSTRLRLHVALRSSLEPLMDDMFRFLDATSVVSLLITTFSWKKTHFWKSRKSSFLYPFMQSSLVRYANLSTFMYVLINVGLLLFHKKDGRETV